MAGANAQCDNRAPLPEGMGSRGSLARLIDREYLRHFITSGGSAVKFVEADAEQLERIQSRLVALAEHHGLARCRINASETRLHMIQDIFFAISHSLDWSAMAQDFVEALVTEHGYGWPRPGGRRHVPGSWPATTRSTCALFRRDLNRWLTEDICARPFDEPGLSRRRWRTLCRTRLEPDETDRSSTRRFSNGCAASCGPSARSARPTSPPGSPVTTDARCFARSAGGCSFAGAKGSALRSIFVRSSRAGPARRGAAVHRGGGDRRVRGVCVSSSTTPSHSRACSLWSWATRR